eukprot:GFKZ01012743.1.p1 GENE.GFKZ01012743.1~~GFKZ01012743.1.p1  ORF type:complete len:737 (+),score=78.34 GFKZ01012743.1:509-2719(+)
MQQYRLGLITWNVGGAPPGVAPGTHRLLQAAAHCDVIIVGLQEVSVARRGWKAELRKSLGKDWAYIGGEIYAGMRVKVFARLSAHKPPVPVPLFAALSPQDTARFGLNVRAGKHPVVGISGGGKRVGVGLADRWPNKGAVAVEIRFGPACRAVFVVAHLAANEEQVQGREDDWHAILRRLDRDELPLTRGPGPAIWVPLFHRYEHVFVLGDLNYRLSPPGTDHKERVEWVRDLVQRKEWDRLVDVDQLTREIAEGNVFANFQEGDITFPPTFKFDPRTKTYSESRVPSYCDRILWHSLPARMDLVKCVKYTSLTDFDSSDHLPVYGEYKLDVPVVAAPPRSLIPKKGMRIVLEFMLVRYVKGTRQFSKREAFNDGPPSMRHLKEPATLTLPCPRENGMYHARCVDSGDFQDDEGIDGIDRDEDEEYEYDEDEDEEDDTSSMSSDEAENYPLHANGIDVPDRDTVEGRALEKDSDAFRRRATVASSPATGIHIDLDLVESEFRGRALGPPVVDSPALSTRSADTSETSIFNPEHRNRDSPRPTAHENSAPRKRDSLSRQVEDSNRDERSKRANSRRRLNKMRMEVHGEGMFLKQGRVYSVGIPKGANGSRERIGESLPVIPFAPIENLGDLQYRHILIEFAKKNSRVGTSGALPLRELLRYIGRQYAFELFLTKYGHPVGILEACVQLSVSDSGFWVDSKGRVVRNSDGSSTRHYKGLLPVRKRTRAKSKPQNMKRI